MQDPTLQLHDGSGTAFAFNDNWRDTQQTEVLASGIPPPDNREASIVATVMPGAYTAVVRGKNQTSGVALIEVYALQTASPPEPQVVTAAFTWSFAGSKITVDGSASSSPHGIAQYDWNWGDGTLHPPTSSPTATHTYSSTWSGKTAVVSLLVTDQTGRTGFVQKQIAIGVNPSPTPTPPPPTTPTPPPPTPTPPPPTPTPPPPTPTPTPDPSARPTPTPEIVTNLFISISEPLPWTQTYELRVGPYTFRSSLETGSTGPGFVYFERGQRYPISITRISGSGNDYTARVIDFGAQAVFVDDPDGILGEHHGGGSDFPTSGKQAFLIVPKVELITPAGDPVAAPHQTSGTDGQNEFVFSSANPGVLTLPFKAKVTPSGVADRFKSLIRFSADSVGNDLQKEPLSVEGDFVSQKFIVTGLPETNAGFGLKGATVSLKEQPSPDRAGSIDSKSFEVFFPKEATNHPAGQAGSPNWFYYWATTPANKTDTTRVKYFKTFSDRSKYEFAEDMIYLADRAAVTGILAWGEPKGIDSYAWSTAHEAKHRRQLQGFWPNGRDPYNDQDLPAPDFIPDNLEPSYMSGRPYDPTKQSTYPDDIGYGEASLIRDTEDIAMRSQTGQNGHYPVDVLWTNGSANAQDWANPGKNSREQH